MALIVSVHIAFTLLFKLRYSKASLRKVVYYTSGSGLLHTTLYFKPRR